ncbi:MAG TPA: zinc ribbon domain-containing protein [Candidatus Acidoferrales bacterium]|jgi:putative FmdB family regulatory protein|nr:zinc ribbon domain-containing protein [Candidatus Acidoferrales bacterium]
MPHYDYRCQECKKKFYVLLTVEEHDRRKPKCPHCGSTKVEQQWAAFFAVTGKKS